MVASIATMNVASMIEAMTSGRLERSAEPVMIIPFRAISCLIVNAWADTAAVRRATNF
jgi:hypothetical protein